MPNSTQAISSTFIQEFDNVGHISEKILLDRNFGGAAMQEGWINMIDLWIVRVFDVIIMEELRKENELLLKLVSTLQSQIKSKTMENQLLFQQYDQLALENKKQAAQILASNEENRELRRASLTPRDAPKYTYAVLNSPRTQRLIAELQQAQIHIQIANKQNKSLSQQLEDLNTKIIKDSNSYKQYKKEQGGVLGERIGELQRDLLKKEREMKELTLIMYAKDASAAEIMNRQYNKDREIDGFKQQIAILKVQQGQKLKLLTAREQQIEQMSKNINQLTLSLEKSQRQMIKTAQLQQRLQERDSQMKDLQSELSSKSQNLEQLSCFMNEQTENLQKALETIQSYKQIAPNIQKAQQILKAFETNIQSKQKQSIIMEQKLRYCENQLQKIQENSILSGKLIAQSLNEIQSYKQIRKNLIAQIQNYGKRIIICKQELETTQQKVQKTLNAYHQEIARQSHQVSSLKSEQNKLRQSIQGLHDRYSKIELQGQLQKSRGELIEKQQFMTTLMGVLESLQAQIRQKDFLIDDLRSKQEQLRNRCLNMTKQLIQNQQSFKKQRYQMKQATKIRQLQLNAPISQNESLKAENDKLQQKLKLLQLKNIDLNKVIAQKQAKVGDSEVLLRRAQEKTNGRQGEKQQYIEMLNAVIQNIKNQHQESISKLHTKNHIIFELQKRLQQAQHNYQTQITTLRNSIACQETISYDQLVVKFPKRAPPKETSQEQVDEMMQQIQILREELILKDSELLKLKKKCEENKRQISQTMQDNNCRPISNISPLHEYPHILEMNNKNTSRIQLENQSLHETIDEQNQKIMELQDDLLRAERSHNSEVIALRRNIAELNAEVLLLKRILYESNPKSMELSSFVKNSSKSEATSFGNPRSTSALTSMASTNAHSHSQQLSQQRPSKVSYNPSMRSNPYIAMMTNEKGELRFPQGGSWSIQELRNLIQ